MSSYTQEVFPSTSLDESSLEFEFETDRNLYLDMRDTHLSLKLQLFKGRLFDAFKKEKAEHKAKSEEDSEEEPQTYLTYVNTLLHSLFSNCEVYFNNTMLTIPMDYILIRHKYLTNSTRQQCVIKEYLLVMDTVLKNILMHLICTQSLIEQNPWEQG